MQNTTERSMVRCRTNHAAMTTVTKKQQRAVSAKVVIKKSLARLLAKSAGMRTVTAKPTRMVYVHGTLIVERNAATRDVTNMLRRRAFAQGIIKKSSAGQYMAAAMRVVRNILRRRVYVAGTTRKPLVGMQRFQAPNAATRDVTNMLRKRAFAQGIIQKSSAGQYKAAAMRDVRNILRKQVFVQGITKKSMVPACTVTGKPRSYEGCDKQAQYKEKFSRNATGHEMKAAYSKQAV